MSRWNRYWFPVGDRISAAVLRIAIGTSVLWMLWRLRGGHASTPEASPHDAYHALGVLHLFPGEPGANTFAVIWVIAWAGAVAMILGVWSRAAVAASFAAALAIATYEHAFQPTWSHVNNLPLVAQLAFLGARGGDALSIDAWWRRRQGGGPPADHSYAWSVRLVQLAVALVMASAAFSKLVAGGLDLSWVLSDNLRNHLLVRFDLGGRPRTVLADWLLAAPWRWQLAAGLNLAAQIAPLVGCFIRRPRLRALLGGVFVLEVVMLDLVMAFSNFHWLPLAAAFVDWDRLVAWRRARPIEAAARIAVPGRVARGFVIAFLVADLPIAFWRWPKIDQRIGAYPLSTFPMFASIRARAPYHEHRVYEIPGGTARFDVVVEAALPEPARRWIAEHGAAPGLQGVRDRDRVRAELEGFAARVGAAFPALAVRGVRLHLVAIRARPYPEPAGLERVDVAILGELVDGAFTSQLGAAEGGRRAYYVDGDYRDARARPRRSVGLALRDGRWFVVD